MARKPKRLRMHQRFFLRNFATIVLPVVGVIVVLGGLSIWQAYRSTGNDLMQQEDQAAARLADTINVYFSEVDAQNLNYEASSYIMLRLSAILERGYADKTLMDSANLIKNNLDASVNAKPYIHSILIYLDNAEKRFFASGVGLATPDNYRDTQWMEAYAQSPDEVGQWLSLRQVGQYGLTRQQTMVISLFHKLYRAGQVKPFGVIVLNVRQQALEDFLQRQLLYKGQTLLLKDDRGAVLARAGAAQDDTDRLLFEADAKDYDMIVVSSVPRQALYAQVAPLIGYVELSIAVSLLIGALLAFLVTRKNVRSIMRIVDLIGRTERGETLDQPVSRKQDMYDVIMQNIVQGALQRNALSIKLAEEKYTLQTVYFQFLEAQLNPHFLVNTLKNIFWMTVGITGKPNKASEMVDLLSGLLYYTLIHPNSFATLREEREQTERYLCIMQIRYDDLFTVAWEMDEGIGEVPCFKFLLQPLAENSISHGFRNHSGGKLRFVLQREGNAIRITVADNGVGMSAEKLQALTSALMRDRPPESGIGLYNLNKRLLIGYGSDAGLKVESREGEGTRISFRITPLIPRGGEQEMIGNVKRS